LATAGNLLAAHLLQQPASRSTYRTDYHLLPSSHLDICLSTLNIGSARSCEMRITFYQIKRSRIPLENKHII